MAGRLPYGPRYRYPHMLPDEREIWQKFMVLNPSRFETVDYDFRVGRGAPIPPGEEPHQARMITMLSQKRIDVLAWEGEDPTIIEIKRRVGLGTLGQIEGYKILFMNYFPMFQEPNVLVVCEEISDDDRFVLEAAAVPVTVV